MPMAKVSPPWSSPPEIVTDDPRRSFSLMLLKENVNSYGEDRTSMFSRLASSNGSRAGAASTGMNTLNNETGDVDGDMEVVGELDGMLEIGGDLEGQGTTK